MKNKVIFHRFFVRLPEGLIILYFQSCIYFQTGSYSEKSSEFGAMLDDWVWRCNGELKPMMHISAYKRNPHELTAMCLPAILFPTRLLIHRQVRKDTSFPSQAVAHLIVMMINHDKTKNNQAANHNHYNH